MFKLLLMAGSGAIRRAGKAALYTHRNELGDILSSGWFWAIIVIAIICVIIYAIVNNDK